MHRGRNAERSNYDHRSMSFDHRALFLIIDKYFGSARIHLLAGDGSPRPDKETRPAHRGWCPRDSNYGRALDSGQSERLFYVG